MEFGPMIATLWVEPPRQPIGLSQRLQHVSASLTATEANVTAREHVDLRGIRPIFLGPKA